jgi:hypothetical protein
MKDQILKVVNSLAARKEMLNSKFSLSLNLKDVVPDYGDKIFSKDSVEFIKEIIKKEGKINSFNITLRLERGVDFSDDEENIFKDGWRTLRIYFHMNNLTDNDDPERKNYLKYCRFGFNTAGDRQSLNLAEKLYFIDYENVRKIETNYVKYEEVDKIIDLFIQFDRSCIMNSFVTDFI